MHSRVRAFGSLIAIAGIVGACATAPAASPAAAHPTATPSSAPVISPSPSIAPTVSPSEGPVTLESIVYPYSLTVPPRSLTRAWVPATQLWDGAAPINMLGGSPVIDRVGLTEGGLFMFGAPAPTGLEAFFKLHAENGSRFHGCGAPTNRRDITIGGVPAIAFVQHCLADQTRAQVTIVKGGFGLACFIDAAHGTELTALDHLIGLLGGLHWKST